jgi:hypothetical protein
MAQLSRPYQIALAALGVLALAWFAVLHRPGSSSSSEPAPAPTAHVSSANSNSSSPGASTSTYHGAAPGVTGLTRDIAKAHGAAATSERNAQQLKNKSAQASNETTPSTAGTPSAQHATSTPTHTPTHVVVHKTVVHKPAAPRNASVVAAAQTAAQKAVLKHELSQGKTVLLLFWNPKSSDDKSVRKALLGVSGHLNGKVAVHVALASQVGRYGSMTRNVEVLQTPTLLIVGKQGLAVTMTGLVDQYAIEQAIREAKTASAH